MIVCEYVKNFFPVFLPIWLSTRGEWLSTHGVETIWLTVRAVIELSTICYFGAKLISLYLFPPKIC